MMTEDLRHWISAVADWRKNVKEKLRKKKFKEREKWSRKEDKRLEWSRMKCSRSNNTERSERVGWDCQEPITLWASNSHTKPLSWCFYGPPCLRSERIRSMRYQKGKVNVSKRQIMSFFNWSVGFPDWFVELKRYKFAPKPF